MALKHIYDLETTTLVEEDHSILVYQDKKLKKLNAEDIFYSKEYVNNNIVNQKNDIISALCNLNVNVPDNATLFDLVGYVNQIDLFEIGYRRMVHDGTDTRTFTGIPSANNNPKSVSMGMPQTSSFLDRCYRVGDILTIIPSHTPNASSDLLHASFSKTNYMGRNDFYGGDYASDNWKNGIYPWNSMQQVTDDHNNEFTRCPLYFIKTEFKTVDGIDITDTWPIIPDRYINDIIYEYNFVCKTRLQGYRPARFFIKYIPRNMIEDLNGVYIYIDDLDCYHIPNNYKSGQTRYSIDSVTSTEYSKILTRYHDFSCKEAGTETVGGLTVIASKSGLLPTINTQLATFRTYCNNLNPDSDIKEYHVRDIRSYTDFFFLLWDIEFACTHSQYEANGVTNFEYSASYTVQEAATDTNTIKVNYSFRENSYICIGTALGNMSIARDRKVLSTNLLSGNIYEITIDDDPITVTASHIVWNTRYNCGYTDESEFRTSIANSQNSTNTYYPFKWNWIENPFGNIWKFIDGVHIKHEADENGLLNNCIYVCDNPYLYSNTFNKYEKLQYNCPSEFLNSSNARTTANAHVEQLGYDPNYPWARLTAKVGSRANTVNGYGDYLSENTNTSSNSSSRCVLSGGRWNDGSAAGLRYFLLVYDIDTSRIDIGAAFERQGE